MDIQALQARIVELEARLAFQEHSLAQLSDALAESRLESQRYGDLLRQLLEEFRNTRGSLYADPSQEPPPPHY